MHRLAAIHSVQTDDKRTQHCSISVRSARPKTVSLVDAQLRYVT